MLIKRHSLQSYGAFFITLYSNFKSISSLPSKTA